MALEWLDAIEEQAPDPTVGFSGVPAAPLRANPSNRTTYCIYLGPEDDYLTVVTIKARSGPMSVTHQLKSDAPSEDEAKAAAQADWDSGKRP